MRQLTKFPIKVNSTNCWICRKLNRSSSSSSAVWSSTRFAGSGTVPKMAWLNYRNYLGFEINPNYVKLARRRLRDVEASMASAEMGG